MEKIRIDKWLWTVRIFKTRTLASNACKSGKVKVKEKNAKPSLIVFPGDVIRVSKNGFDLTFKVEKIIKSRVSATIAAPCYEDLTPESELNKYKDWFVGKSQSEGRDKGSGRPTKKDRRELLEYKDETIDYDLFD